MISSIISRAELVYKVRQTRKRKIRKKTEKENLLVLESHYDASHFLLSHRANALDTSQLRTFTGNSRSRFSASHRCFRADIRHPQLKHLVSHHADKRPGACNVHRPDHFWRIHSLGRRACHFDGEFQPNKSLFAAHHQHGLLADRLADDYWLDDRADDNCCKVDSDDWKLGDGRRCSNSGPILFRDVSVGHRKQFLCHADGVGSDKHRHNDGFLSRHTCHVPWGIADNSSKYIHCSRIDPSVCCCARWAGYRHYAGQCAHFRKQFFGFNIDRNNEQQLRRCIFDRPSDRRPILHEVHRQHIHDLNHRVGLLAEPAIHGCSDGQRLLVSNGGGRKYDCAGSIVRHWSFCCHFLHLL